MESVGGGRQLSVVLVDEVTADAESGNSEIAISHIDFGSFPKIICKERKKEMFCLTMHSTHLNYGYIGVRHMVEDLSNSER